MAFAVRRISAAPCPVARSVSRSSVTVRAAAWTKVSTKEAIATGGGKLVVEVPGVDNKVLLVLDGESVFAVSNKCTHLGLPLVGKTPIFQAAIKEGCVVCPAHQTAFDLKTGEVKGTWCPGFPDIPFVGKGTPAKPLPTYESRVGPTGDVEVFA